MAVEVLVLSISLSVSTVAGAQTAPLLAQVYPREDCFSRRETIQAVAAGRAKPLRDMRRLAEEAVGGEMVDADMCRQNGALTYVLTVLTGTGKVAYVTLDAAKGSVLNVR